MNVVETVAGYGGYPLAVRVFDPVEGPRAQLVLLHGVVSHSEWLSPLAEVLAADGIQVVCPDRRGSGLNEESPGDAPTVEALLQDVEAVVRRFERPNVPRHLAGFCWGANYAIALAHASAPWFRSLILIAPGVFSLPALTALPIELGDSPEPTEEPSVPLEYFTTGPLYRDYILPDPLRTRRVSPRFNKVMAELNGRAAPLWAGLRLPTLMILASRDRMSDNAKLRRAFRVLRASPKEEREVDAEHGIQFDAPNETAAIVVDWMKKLETASLN